MPNLTYMRPCDAEEVIGAWMLALAKTTGPSMLSLGRDPVGPLPGTHKFKVYRGAYVVVEAESPKLVLASCGTSLHYAVAAAGGLSASGVPTRVVSAPSFEHFDAQGREYRDSVFPLDGTPVVSDGSADDWTEEACFCRETPGTTMAAVHCKCGEADLSF